MHELVLGERFTRVAPTPLLGETISRARAELEAAVIAAVPSAVVLAEQQWSFGSHTCLTPSLVVLADPDASAAENAVPDLIVEFRTESTSRYVMGPKRMAYSRSRVPEFWFVDAWRQRLAVLVSESGEEYTWPPRDVGADEVLEPVALPGARVHAHALLRGWPRDRAHPVAANADEPWFETS